MNLPKIVYVAKKYEGSTDNDCLRASIDEGELANHSEGTTVGTYQLIGTQKIILKSSVIKVD